MAQKTPGEEWAWAKPGVKCRYKPRGRPDSVDAEILVGAHRSGHTVQRKPPGGLDEFPAPEEGAWQVWLRLPDGTEKAAYLNEILPLDAKCV